MKKIIITVVFVFSLGIAQVGPLLPPVNPAPPRPEWLKPGLAVTYGDEVGQAAVAYLVTRVGPTSAYGLSFRLSQSEAGLNLNIEAGPLYEGGSGPLYVSQQAVETMLRNPPPGLEVVGDRGAIGWTIQDADGVSKYAVRYNPDSGQIIEMNGSYQGPGGVGARRGAAFHLALLGTSELPWNPPADFPAAAFRRANYGIYYLLQGGTTPGGTVTVTPVQVKTPLATYRLVSNIPGSPSLPQEKQGVPAFGPQYVHPSLLAHDPIFVFPEIGLTLSQAGQGPNGGVSLVFYVGQTPIQSLEVDPQSGALIEERFDYAGIGTVVYQLMR